MSGAYGLVVIGGGTAGLTAAIGAAKLGARVALVEANETTGGECLWTGCVPSKALLAAAKLVHDARHAERLGLPTTELNVDLAAVMDHVRSAQQAIAPHDSPERLRREGVEVIEGRARFDGPGRIAVDGRVLSYRAAFIATGSRPLVPPIDGIDEARPLTTDTVWELEDLPRRLLILGGGAIGCELGQAFARLGSEVTIVEMRDHLLPTEEPEASAIIAEKLAGEGVDVRVGTTLASLTGDTATLERGSASSTVAFDRFLVATGRQANTDDLGLDTVGVETDDDGAIVVDATMRTTGRAIYAAGDVTGGLPFTHVAYHEARTAVGNALFHLRRRVSYRGVPWATFTDPEVGRVGLAERQARLVYGDRVRVALFRHRALDRAITAGRGEGMTKLVADPRGRLIGGTVVSVTGGESITPVAHAVARGERLSDVSNQVIAYPTFTGSTKQAADALLTERWLSDRTRRFTTPVLRLLRALEAPR